MNEALKVTLRKQRRKLPISSCDSRGLVLGQELAALPRALRLVIWPATEVTARRVDWMLRRRGAAALELKVSLQDGDLLVRGVDENGLPFGHYWFRPDIEDLKTDRQRLDLREGQTLGVVVEVTEDRRQVQMRPKIDPAIARILDQAGSTLDGRSLREWLADDDVRAKRKACLLNILAKLRCLPRAGDPLITWLARVFFCDVDRIYAEVDPQLLARVRELAVDPQKPFYAEGSPVHPAHQRLLEYVDEGGNYTLDSYREEGAPSMQVVFAVPSEAGDRHYAEFDIDLANPLQDFVSLVVHASEVIDDARSDHLALWKKLQQGREAKFLPYDVVRA